MSRLKLDQAKQSVNTEIGPLKAHTQKNTEEKNEKK